METTKQEFSIENAIEKGKLTIEIVKADDENFKVKFSSNGQTIEKNQLSSKVNRLVKSLYSERTGHVTTGFSWSGLQTKKEICQKLGECGYKILYGSENIGKDNSIVKELEKYQPVYNDIYAIHNSLTDSVIVHNTDSKEFDEFGIDKSNFTGHCFAIVNSKNDVVLVFRRSNYLSTIDSKLETLERKAEKRAEKAKKAKANIEKKIAKLKEMGLTKSDLLEMLK